MRLENAFGQVLRTHRERMKISQEGLALACGLDRTFMSALERGVRQPSLKSIFKIARVLDVPPSQLVAEVELLVTQCDDSTP
ncbi:MAG: helix-turn-helix domain-containing protein [Desulfobulbus sp.]|jgi:transcriptional regulator with XRE-family HTH domain